MEQCLLAAAAQNMKTIALALARLLLRLIAAAMHAEAAHGLTSARRTLVTRRSALPLRFA